MSDNLDDRYASLKKEYKDYTVDRDLLFLLKVYGKESGDFEEKKKSNKGPLLDYLTGLGVRVHRVQPRKVEPDLDQIEWKGPKQFDSDYPPYDNLDIKKDLIPAAKRYSIPFEENDTRDKLLRLLENNDTPVPLHRMEPRKEQPNMDDIMEEGPEAILVDYPPLDNLNDKRSTTASLGGYQTSDSNSEGTGSGGSKAPGSSSSGTDSRDASLAPNLSPDGTGPLGEPGTSASSSGGNGVEIAGITSARTQRLKDLPQVQDFETKALAAKVPPAKPGVALEKFERDMIFDSPLGQQCLPSINGSVRDDEIKAKIIKYIVWLVSIVKTSEIDVGRALVYLDSYFGYAGVIDPVAYLLNTDNAQSEWHKATSNPDESNKAAKLFGDTWNFVMGKALSATPPLDTTAGSNTPEGKLTLTMKARDPRDAAIKDTRILGKHPNFRMLAVVFPSLNDRFPERTHGEWIKCSKEDTYATQMLTKATSKPYKLFLTSETTLPCDPQDFEIGDVFIRKNGAKQRHIHLTQRAGDPEKVYARSLFDSSINERLDLHVRVRSQPRGSINW